MADDEEAPDDDLPGDEVDVAPGLADAPDLEDEEIGQELAEDDLAGDELAAEAPPVAADDDEDDDEVPAPAAKAEDEEDDDEADPDDVEADLDTILRDRIAAGTDDDEEDEEEAKPEPEPTGDAAERVQPKRPEEFVCQSCFLVKHPSQLADAKNKLCLDCV